MNKLAIKIIFYVLVAGVAFGAALVYFRSTAPASEQSPENIVASNSNRQEIPDKNPTCIITVNGKIYDVQPLRSPHPGGDVFKCGTDMTDIYRNQHGQSVKRIEKYLIK